MLLRILYYYYKTLWLKQYLNTPEKLRSYQEKRFRHLVKHSLIHAPYFKEYLDKPLEQWPLMNKHIMMEHFDSINTLGIDKEEALALALHAEKTRDFSGMIKGVAVGLSSGTSGKRGLFLVSPRERDAWAGIILAKVLPHDLTRPERIAFFLRANNPLYKTLNKSKKIQFYFFDLLGNFDEHIADLNRIQPSIISAPASVLLLLAKNKARLQIHPQRVIAVAEVLEPADEAIISAAFQQPVAQIYQCTEGFLAASDKKTNALVMNEDFLIIEKEWLDEQHFIPIVTDLLRTTQPIIRYRLDDVLVKQESTGPFTELAAIQGRLGDVCYGLQGDKTVPLFADLLRQAMASSPVAFDDYLICQESLRNFSIQVDPEVADKQVLEDHLNHLFQQKGCAIPKWTWQAYEKRNLDAKRRRIQSRMTG